MGPNAELLAEINSRVEHAKATGMSMILLTKEVQDIHTKFPHRCEEYIREQIKEALRKNGMVWDPEQ